MPMVIVGVLLLLAKMAEFGPFARWSWWLIMAPFAVAVAWWQFADTSGWTQRRAMDKMDKRKADRRARALEALGLNSRRERQVTQAREDAARRTTTTADPTQKDHAPSASDPAPRREPRL